MTKAVVMKSELNFEVLQRKANNHMDNNREESLRPSLEAGRGHCPDRNRFFIARVYKTMRNRAFKGYAVTFIEEVLFLTQYDKEFSLHDKTAFFSMMGDEFPILLIRLELY